MIFAATIEKVQTMADHTLQVRIGTQEMKPPEMAELFSYVGRYAMAQLETNLADIVKLDPPPMPKVEGKSKSERLRGVLFLNWKQASEGHTEFETYYSVKMETIIDYYKGKLD